MENTKVYLCKRRKEEKNRITFYLKFNPPLIIPGKTKRLKTLTLNISIDIKPESTEHKKQDKIKR